MKDFSNIQLPQHLLSSSVSMYSTQMSSTADATGSEAGQIGADIGAAIAQWNEQLNSDLQDWYDDAMAMQQMLEQMQFVASEIAYCYEHAQTQEGAGGGGDWYIPQSHYDDLVLAMEDLGIPQSQMAAGTVITSGDHAGQVHMTQTDFQQDLQLMLDYAKADAPQVQNELSGYQQDETKDMLAVMYDITAIKQNQQALSGIWSALKQMAQVIEGNIQ